MQLFSLSPLVRALALLGVFAAAFVLMIVLTPHAREHPWMALALFCGLLGLLKLLSSFEQPRG